ncbi:MAG: HAD family hydrolase [Chitinophagaceae bacterium]|nr:HAD family hydrolase [Oligoflexus sp.]
MSQQLGQGEVKAKTKTAAFFDLDRTLIDVNSTILFAKFEHAAKRISQLQFLNLLRNVVLYHFNLVKIERAYEQAIAHYAGFEEGHIESRTFEFFENQVRSRLQPGAKAALSSHRAQGHALVMLTASTSFQAKIATSAWGLDDWIANRFETNEGRMSGKIKLPLCYGDGKLVYAKEWAEVNGVDLGLSYFYSDSYTDLPMLKAVGFPVVVNPDPKLRRYALTNGWPVVDWTESAGGHSIEKASGGPLAQ